MNLNQVNIIGRVGQDPEVKSLPSGRLVCSFSVATTRTWTQEGQKKEQTEWHNIVFFGDNLIEKVIEPYVKKGSEVYIGGRLQTRSWEVEGGKKAYRTEIIGEQIQLGSRPKDSGGDERPARASRKSAGDDADAAFDTAFGTQEPDADSPTARKRAAAKGGGKGRGNSNPDDINPDDIPF